MKSLIIALLFASPFCLLAQTSYTVNTDTKRAEYTEVVQTPNFSQDVLYGNALRWIASEFKNPAGVIQKKDSSNFTITGKHQFQLWDEVKGVKVARGFMRYTFIIACRDGRFKYTFTNFNPTSETSYVDLPDWVKKKPENAKQEKPFIDFITKKIESLKAAMTNIPQKKQEEW